MKQRHRNAAHARFCVVDIIVIFITEVPTRDRSSAWILYARIHIGGRLASDNRYRSGLAGGLVGIAVDRVVTANIGVDQNLAIDHSREQYGIVARR